MIFLFTDFGREGPYMGQMEAVLRRIAPAIPVGTLLADAPVFNTEAAAYLLPAYARDVAAGDVVLCVVDPGVGTVRDALVLNADGRWFVGPDNGVMAMVARRAKVYTLWRITWRPEHLSASFHGRDLFAPIAALLATEPAGAVTTRLACIESAQLLRPHWPDQHAALITFDHYGNAITGIEASTVDSKAIVECAGRTIYSAATFGAVPVGEAFWYANSSGLLEIAVNQGSARLVMGLKPGLAVHIRP